MEVLKETEWVRDTADKWWADEEDLTISSPSSSSSVRAQDRRVSPQEVLRQSQEQYRRITESSRRVVERVSAAVERVNSMTGFHMDTQSIRERLKRMEAASGTFLDYEQMVRYNQVNQYKGEGDIEGALSSLANLSGVDSIQCVHADTGIRRVVTEQIESWGVRDTLRHIASTLVFYGQSTHSQLWVESQYQGTMVFNPRNIAVSHYPTVFERDMVYRPQGELNLSEGRGSLYHTIFTPDWDAYMEVGTNALPLNPDVTSHTRETDLPFVRYSKPRISSAIRALSYRAALDEMRMSTTEGLTNQITVFKLSEPQTGEMTVLRNQVNSTRAERTKQFVWRDNLTVEQLHPASVGELLTDESIVRATADVFRHLRLGVELTGSTLAFRQMSPEQVEYMIWSMLTQATWIQSKVRSTWLAKYTENFNRGTRWGRRRLSPTDFIFVPTALDIAYRIKSIVQPLATYGIISAETAMRLSGLDFEKEIARITDEWESGLRDKIRPFSSFSQTVQPESGEEKTTDSISKPGRTPDQANPNKE